MPKTNDISLRDLLRPFQAQSRLAHLITVVVGIALWGTVYLAILSMYGGLDLAVNDAPATYASRRDAAMLASIFSAVYFSIAWTQGLGGPFINILYFGIFTAFGPMTISYILSGQLVGFSTRGRIARIPDLLYITFPSIIVFFGILYLWQRYFITDETRSNWTQKHMPEQFLPADHSTEGRSETGYGKS